MTSVDTMPEPVYRHRQGLASGIPLGGLGAGSVELRDDGRFYDWEIFNNYSWSGDPDEAGPEMWSEDAFFALRVKEEGGDPRVRLLYHDDGRAMAADHYYRHALMYNFPFLRNVAGITYSGQFPFARLAFDDDALPVDVTLEAFTPFIPFNAKDSALPLAFFTFRLRNGGDVPCEASLMFSLRNCVGYDHDRLTLVSEVGREGAASVVAMTADGLDPEGRTSGSLAVAALGEGVTGIPAWTGGRGLHGFEHILAPAFPQVFYPFRDEGELWCDETEWQRTIERREPKHKCGELHYPKVQQEWRWRGAVCRKVSLQPGEEAEVVFMMSWHFPNHHHEYATTVNLGHMYGNWFADARQAVAYGAEHFDRLRAESRAFCDGLYGGTIEPWLAASLNAQLTTFPQAAWWTRAGDFTMWEGSACCQTISAGHTPWSSWQPLMFFPELYMPMMRRVAAFGDESGADASPLLAAKREYRRAADPERREQLGGWLAQRYRQYGYTEDDLVRPGRLGRSTAMSSEAAAVQALRNYQWTGDEDYLREVGPLVVEMVEAGLEADRNGDGLPDGALSYITYDHWFLPATNCYKCSMWLAELSAAARIAELLGEGERAGRLREVLARGAATFEELLWNGEYYNLCHDEKLGKADEGCMADQVSGHLYLRLCGLAPVHDEERTRLALQAVHRYCRVPEQGMVNGVDPRGRDDWRYFCRFSMRGDDEALAGQWVTPWTGTEYYVAALMMAEGLVEEGLDVARDIYERHVAAGMLYNHIECGEHYFRPMAAWAMLPALQGLLYDAAAGALTFAPKIDPHDHDTAFILPGAWGRLTQTRQAGAQTNGIAVDCGQLALGAITLAVPESMGAAARCSLGSRDLPLTREASAGRLTLTLSEPVMLREGDRLTIRLGE